MQNHFIGRKPELKILEDALTSKQAEMITVVGRRRVGKTMDFREKHQNQKANRSHFYYNLWFTTKSL